MGSGFFPVAVGALLALLSLGILAELRTRGAERLRLPWRPLALITLALIVFALGVERLGIVPSTILLVLVGSFADRAMTLRRAATSALVLAALGYAVFILGFGLPLDPFWW